MVTPGTIAFSDLYGGKTPGSRETNMEGVVETSSGADFATRADLARPTIFWVVLVGMLVAIRLLAKLD